MCTDAVFADAYVYGVGLISSWSIALEEEVHEEAPKDEAAI